MDTKERLFDMLAGKGHPVEREVLEIVWDVAQEEWAGGKLPMSSLEKAMDRVIPPKHWHSSTRRSHA